MKKRSALSLILALALCLGALSPMAAAAENSDTLTSGGVTVYIRGYTRKCMETYLSYYDEEEGTTEAEYLVYYVPESGATIEISGRPQDDFMGDPIYGFVQYYDTSSRGIYPWTSEVWSPELTKSKLPENTDSLIGYFIRPDINFLVRCESDTTPYPYVSWREAPAAVPAPELEPPVDPNAPNTAFASTQVVLVDGVEWQFNMYARKDANGNPTNYVRVRDVASVLNGTKAQFNVDWDGWVNLQPGAAYVPDGSEMATPFSGDRPFTVPLNLTKINGQETDLDAIYLMDDNGGGYTYYQLRDLGKHMGFNVGWSPEQGVYIETDKPYQE